MPDLASRDHQDFRNVSAVTSATGEKSQKR
jgi:hypothetical protein